MTCSCDSLTSKQPHACYRALAGKILLIQICSVQAGCVYRMYRECNVQRISGWLAEVKIEVQSIMTTNCISEVNMHFNF